MRVPFRRLWRGCTRREAGQHLHDAGVCEHAFVTAQGSASMRFRPRRVPQPETTLRANCGGPCPMVTGGVETRRRAPSFTSLDPPSTEWEVGGCRLSREVAMRHPLFRLFVASATTSLVFASARSRRRSPTRQRSRVMGGSRSASRSPPSSTSIRASLP
jgi:hypothetical protein